MEASHDSAPTLARRLRELRTKGMAGGLEIGLTQSQLARALHVSVPLISSWEKNVTPPVSRLNEYARFFATGRSAADGRMRLLTEETLDPEERVRGERLERGLRALRAAALGGAGGDPPTPAANLPAAIGPW